MVDLGELQTITAIMKEVQIFCVSVLSRRKGIVVVFVSRVYLEEGKMVICKAILKQQKKHEPAVAGKTSISF